MTTINMICRKRGGALVPVDFLNQEEMNRVTEFVDVEVKVTVPQTAADKLRLKVLAKMWMLADVVAKNFPIELYDKDVGMEFLCLSVHHSEIVKSPLTGRETVRRKSISDPDLNLSALLDRMITFTCKELLPRLPETALRKELEELTVDKRYAGYAR